MRALLVVVLLAITFAASGLSSRRISLSDALSRAISQAEYENNVNEMAKLVSNLGENPEKLPHGWRPVYTYTEKYGDKGYQKNRVFVNDKTKQVVMGYGGTQMEIKDWDKNLDFKQVPLKINGKDFGKVHRGFKKQFQRTEKKMFENAQRYLKKGYSLEVAGHSQGGAAGTIASLYAKEKYGVKNLKVVTFGSPAAGNQDFAKKYNSKIKDNTRVVNSVELVPGTHSYDPVSHSTSIIPFMKYTHIGKEKKVSNGKGDIISYKGTHDMVNYERATRNKPVMDNHGPIVGFELDAAKNIVKFGKDVGKNVAKGVKDIGKNLGNFGKDIGKNLGNFGKDVMKNLGKAFGGDKKNARRGMGGRFGRSSKIGNKKSNKNGRRGLGGRFGKSNKIDGKKSKSTRTNRNRGKNSKSRSNKKNKQAKAGKKSKPAKKNASKKTNSKKSKSNSKRGASRSTGKKSVNRSRTTSKAPRSRSTPRAPRRAPSRTPVRAAPRRASPPARKATPKSNTKSRA